MVVIEKKRVEEREQIDPAVKHYERDGRENTAAGWGAWKVGDKDGGGVVRLGEGCDCTAALCAGTLSNL